MRRALAALVVLLGMLVTAPRAEAAPLADLSVSTQPCVNGKSTIVWRLTTTSNVNVRVSSMTMWNGWGHYLPVPYGPLHVGTWVYWNGGFNGGPGSEALKLTELKQPTPQDTQRNMQVLWQATSGGPIYGEVVTANQAC